MFTFGVIAVYQSERLARRRFTAEFGGWLRKAAKENLISISSEDLDKLVMTAWRRTGVLGLAFKRGRRLLGFTMLGFTTIGRPDRFADRFLRLEELGEPTSDDRRPDYSLPILHAVQGVRAMAEEIGLVPEGEIVKELNRHGLGLEAEEELRAYLEPRIIGEHPDRLWKVVG